MKNPCAIDKKISAVPNNKEMNRFKISVWEVVLGAPDRVDIPWFMHDTLICQIDLIMTNN